MEATNILYITSINDIILDGDCIRKGVGENLFIIDKNSIRESIDSLVSWSDKIIAALQLKSEDFSIIDLEQARLLRMTTLCKYYKNIIIFSPKYDSIGISAQLSPNIFYSFNSTNILFTESIDAVRDNDELKKRFWLALKKHYLA